jgi:predicted permease
MAGLRRLWLRLVHALRPSRGDAEAAREIAAHLALLEDEYRRRGMSPTDARTAARRALGGAAQIGLAHRDARGFRWMDEIRVDLRQAIRGLWRHRRSTIVAVLILATVGTVNAVILGVADSVLFRTLPYRHADGVHVLLMLNTRSGQRFTRVGADLLALLAQPHGDLSGIATIESGPSAIMTTPDGQTGVSTESASTNYFDVLGVRAARGRLFTADDAREGGHVAVLAYATWRDRFGSREDVIGRTVTFGDRTFDIVGVLPQGLYLPTLFGTRSEIITAAPLPQPDSRSGAFYPVIRLAPDVSIERGQAQLDALVRSALPAGSTPTTTPVLVPVKTVLFPAGRPILRLLVASALALLVLACVNLASLMLVRSHGRARDVGVRLALGASRAHIIRPVLFEVLAMSVAGGLVAAVVASAVFPALLKQIPPVAYGNAPIGIDLRVGLLAIGVGVLTAMIFTFVPAWRAAMRDARALISAGAGQGSAPAWKPGRLLVAVQVAVTVVLVFGAVVTGRAFVRILSVPLGFDADNVIIIGLRPPRGADAREVFTRALDTLRQRPGIEAAGAVAERPFDGSVGLTEGIRGAAPGSSTHTGIVHVMPGYFEALRIPIVRGRSLSEADRRADPDAAVLSQSAARILFPGREPLGATFESEAGRALHVVGIAGDVRQSLDADAVAQAYVMPPERSGLRSLVIRTRGHDEAVFRDVTQALDGFLPPSAARPAWWSDSLSNVTAFRNPRFQTLVLGTLGLVALTLTAFGIVSVIGFLVVARTRELGIRAVIGATPGSLVALVTRQSVAPVAIGLAAGLVATHWAGRFAEAQLFQVDTQAAGTLVLTAIVVIVTTLVAAYIPSRRAGRVDPVTILRAD